jgi:hypothetical protein
MLPLYSGKRFASSALYRQGEGDVTWVDIGACFDRCGESKGCERGNKEGELKELHLGVLEGGFARAVLV